MVMVIWIFFLHLLEDDTVAWYETQTVPTIIFSDVTKTFGDADFNLSATSSSTGAYTYSIADPAVATLTGSTTTIVGVGSTIVTVTQAAQGNYGSATATMTLTINKADIVSSTIATIASQTYTSSAITVSPTVSFEGTILNESTDYTLSFANNINAGTASLTITGIGNYSGTKTVSFTIVQAAPTIIFNDVTKTYGDADFNLSATSSSTGAYTYSIADPAVATLTGSTTTIVGVGSTIVTVTQTAEGNYTGATATMTLTVDKRDVNSQEVFSPIQFY